MALLFDVHFGVIVGFGETWKVLTFFSAVFFSQIVNKELQILNLF
jgi:hypothetical protein